MKKILLTILTVLIALTITAQQQSINYKAILKDASGNVLSSVPVSVQFIISDANTNIVYQESHTDNTDANGIIILNIGEGTTADIFTDINWASDDHFLNVQVNTGSGLVDMGTTQFMAVPYAKHANTAATATNVTGLETLDEGNGIGWRLKSRDPANYGDIGLDAVDLSISNIASATRGATGYGSTAIGIGTTASGGSSTAIGISTVASADYSTAMGGFATASGLYSTAMGNSTTASGNYSIAMGNGTTASGFNSTAMGDGTEASANYSTAMGFGTNASGSVSTAMGNSTTASGDASTAMGSGTQSIGNNSLALGQNTIASMNNSMAVGAYNENISNAIFSVGYGTSNSNRKNALTILSSGGHIVESNIYGIFIDSPGEDGIYIKSPTNNGIHVSNAGSVGGYFDGTVTGVYARSTNNVNPDIILGGTANTTTGDDGIISSDPNYAGSDIFIRSNDAVVVQLDYDNNEAGEFEIRNGIGTKVFTVFEGSDADLTTSNSGYVMIGNNSTANLLFDTNEIMARNNGVAANLHLQGNGGNVYVNGVIVHTSDKRLKKDITKLPYGLKEILKLNPVAYNWKNRPNQKHKSLGLIAQELQEVVSNVVYEDEDTQKTLHVNYTELIPVLINAIKEQQEIIKSQQLSVNSLQSTVNNQKEDFSALLQRIEQLEKNNQIIVKSK